MPERSYRVLLWTLALLGLAADQATKYGVFGWLKGVESHTYALFQTEPGSRFFGTVPEDEVREGTHRGFFLHVAYLDEAMEKPHVNPGGLFGKKFGMSEEQSNKALAVVSIIAAAAIAYWQTQKKTASDRWLCAALGLILGGALGNSFDRFRFDGVRDFLHWNYLYSDPSGWPVFNIADCCLVVGACLLLLQAFFVPAAQKPLEKEKAAELVGATPQG